LSRTGYASAERQLEKALQTVAKRQNSDGSWGELGREVESFLVLDALRNIEAPQSSH